MALLLLVGCHAGPVAPGPVAVDEGGAVYDDAHVLEVALTLADADWEALRHETRSLADIYGGDCLAQPVASPFGWYTGAATIDGVELGPVGVRKKGFLGSLAADRPSLKLDLDRVDADTRLDGLAKLTLNNGQQDPSGLRTCLAYATFAAAGVPAPRCTLAHVTVNGEDLGVYANVEPVDAAFLSRRGFDPEGALFEGTLSDFRAGWTTTFDPKTPGADVARLDRVVAAVDVGSLDALAAVVDLDAYLTFWAAEVLTGQWDGYDGNTNNFFVYDDPATGRIRLFPWGPDAAFDRAAPFDPAWVAGNAALARAVLLAPGGEAAYRARLEALLDDVWSGDAMLAEVDRLADLAEPWQGADFRSDVRELRRVVAGREDALRAALEADPTGQNGALRDPPCFVARGALTATFATTWDTLDQSPWTTGAMTLDVTWDGAPLAVSPGGAIAGARGESAVVAAYAARADGSYLVPYAWFPSAALAPGRLPVDFSEATGALLYSDGTTPAALVAWIADGELTLDAAASGPGDAVEGTLAGTLVSYGW